MDPELQRKNVQLGLLLFAISLVIAGGAVAVAFLYLHFD
jgi:hypothetical protein